MISTFCVRAGSLAFRIHTVFAILCSHRPFGACAWSVPYWLLVLAIDAGLCAMWVIAIFEEPCTIIFIAVRVRFFVLRIPHVFTESCEARVTTTTTGHGMVRLRLLTISIGLRKPWRIALFAKLLAYWLVTGSARSLAFRFHVVIAQIRSLGSGVLGVGSDHV